ncbi:MAG: hypothetical protein ACRDTM_03465 [Micromonosporaceae bacterium]
MLIAEGKDLDRAIDIGSGMLALARGMESRRIRSRLCVLRTSLAGSADYRPVQELIEQIDNALTLPL